MKIDVIGTVQGITGYSCVARGYSHYLRMLGEDVEIYPIAAPDGDWWNRDPVYNLTVKKDVDKSNADIRLVVANPFFLDNLEDPTQYVIHTVWETSRMPVQWIHRSMATKAVLVGSEFTRKVFDEDGVPSTVVPEGYDEHIFYPDSLPHSRFRFLCVSEWMPRKNIQKLVKVFSDTFAGYQDVELFLKTWSSHGLGQHEMREVIETFNRGRSRVFPIFDPLPDAHMRDLYAQCDVVVSATRGEGFNRTALEGMACGKPNIITNWSAHTEFVTDKNGWLVDYTLEPVIPHFVEYDDSMQWAEIDEEDLAAKLRYAYENQEECRQRGAQAAQDAKKYTWVKVTKQLIKELEKIKGST